MTKSATAVGPEEIICRLDALIAIQMRLAHRLKGEDPKKEVGTDAIFLRGFGLKNPDVAAILGSTSASIAELVSRSQRSKKRKPGAKARPPTNAK
jgi:hypothetical protein